MEEERGAERWSAPPQRLPVTALSSPRTLERGLTRDVVIYPLLLCAFSYTSRVINETLCVFLFFLFTCAVNYL